MNVREAIERRRSIRSIDGIEASRDLIYDLAGCAGLAPSCFNNQPWRFVFAVSKNVLKGLFSCFSTGNEWAFDSTLVIAVCGKKEFDCVMKDGRYYYHFDTGMACAMLMLRATELGLETHAIAGYDQEQVKQVLNIPSDVEVITLIVVGKRSLKIKTTLTPDQLEDEKTRPERNLLEKYAFIDKYGKTSVPN